MFTLDGGGGGQTVNNGSGYTPGDTITIGGGTVAPGGNPASVNYTTGEIVNPGSYTHLPPSPAPTTGGSGTGATVTPHWTTANWGFGGIYPSSCVDYTLGAVDGGEAGPPRSGHIYAFSLGLPGSTMSPADYGGVQIAFVLTDTFASQTQLEFNGEIKEGAIHSMLVNGVPVLTSDASYSYGTGLTLFSWNAELLIPAVGTYDVKLCPGKASGGVVTVDGAYTIHTFTTDGTFTTLVDNLVVDYLNVGGGGDRFYGGGGGGGLNYITGQDMGAKGDNAVTVGLAGSYPDPGGSTTFITTIAGGGSGGNSSQVGFAGACGGGGGWSGAPAGQGVFYGGGVGSVGFAGGIGGQDTDGFNTQGGGGGGMGAIGGDAYFAIPRNVGHNDHAGNGGNGVQNSISGAAIYYSAGGAGAGSGNNGTNGLGIGNPGSGKGAGYGAQNGIVLVRYLT